MEEIRINALEGYPILFKSSIATKVWSVEDRKPRQVKAGRRLGGKPTLKQIAAVSAAFRQGKSPLEQLLAAQRFRGSILSRRQDAAFGCVFLPWKLAAATTIILAVVIGQQYFGVSSTFPAHLLACLLVLVSVREIMQLRKLEEKDSEGVVSSTTSML